MFFIVIIIKGLTLYIGNSIPPMFARAFEHRRQQSFFHVIKVKIPSLINGLKRLKEFLQPVIRKPLGTSPGEVGDERGRHAGSINTSCHPYGRTSIKSCIDGAPYMISHYDAAKLEPGITISALAIII